MTTIKNHTDLGQSLKLAKILRLESADMSCVGEDNVIVTPYLEAKESLLTTFVKEDSLTPCWSLAALFNILSNAKFCHYNDKYFCQYIGLVDDFPEYSTLEYDNPVDACYEMIIHLHELNNVFNNTNAG